MNKRIIWGVVIVAVAAVALYGGISALNDKDTKDVTQTSPYKDAHIEKKSVDNTAKKIGATDKSEAVYAMIGAKDGAKYNVGTTQVEIYEFNNDKMASGVDYLKDAGEVRKDGNIVVLVHGTAAEADAIAKKF